MKSRCPNCQTVFRITPEQDESARRQGALRPGARRCSTRSTACWKRKARYAGTHAGHRARADAFVRQQAQTPPLLRRRRPTPTNRPLSPRRLAAVAGNALVGTVADFEAPEARE